MKRLTALICIASTSLLCLTASTPAQAKDATPAASIVAIGCTPTPVALGGGATISRTCASWDGANAALWVEGTNLAQEFTAVGSATFNILGYLLTIEAQAGIRRIEGGGWEAFLALTKPFRLGPLAAPLEVAPDGSKITVWLLTERQTARWAGAVRSEAAPAASALKLKFYDRSGTLRGTVSAPMVLKAGATPKPPGPDLKTTGPTTTTNPPAVTTRPSGTHSRQGSVNHPRQGRHSARVLQRY